MALDISKAFDRVWHAGLFHKLKSYGISGGIFGLLFSVMTFWMESLHKNIQLMLEFLKTSFLIQHFSYCTLMTFVMMFSVILLSMLMILLSTLTVICGHLICGNNLELAAEHESDLRDTGLG